MLTSTDTGYGNTEIWIKYDNLTEFLGFYILAIKSYNIYLTFLPHLII